MLHLIFSFHFCCSSQPYPQKPHSCFTNSVLSRIVILPIWLNHRDETPPWFNEHESSHKLFLDSLDCTDSFSSEFCHITYGIPLVQEVDDLSIFFPLFILGLGGTCRSAEFTSFLNILLFPRFRIKGLCYYKFISPKLIC